MFIGLSWLWVAIFWLLVQPSIPFGIWFAVFLVFTGLIWDDWSKHRLDFYDALAFTGFMFMWPLSVSVGFVGFMMKNLRKERT